MFRFLIFLVCLFSTTSSAQLLESQKAEFSEYNILGIYNAGFENSKSKWTATGGTFSHTITAAQIYKGYGAASWDSSGSGQYLQSTSVSVPAGLKGNSCLASIRYLWDAGTSSDLQLEVYDGTNIIVEVDLAKTGGYFTEAFASFVCPTSGSIRLRLASNVADPAIIYVDHAFLGGNYKLSNISQAEVVGTLTYVYAVNCYWSSTSASLAAYTADTDCTSPTITGSASAPGTKIPAVVFPTLPAGNYHVEFHANLETGVTAGTQCTWRIYDGTTYKGTAGAYRNAAEYDYENEMSGLFTYTTAQSNVTFQLHAMRNSGTGSCQIIDNLSSQAFEIVVTRYPLSSQAAVTLDTQGWFVNGYLIAPSNLGVTAVGSYTQVPAISTGVLTLNSNSQPAYIACDGADSTGTTCTGSEDFGISFWIQKSGAYQVCTDFTVQLEGDGNDVAENGFRLAETSNSSDTVITDGTNGIYTRAGFDNAGVGGFFEMRALNTCETFYFSSVGKKTVRLFYSQSVSGTPTSNYILANSATRAAAFTVIPLTNNFPQAVALTDIDPTKMTSGAAATKAGMKQYVCGTAYTNGTPTCTGTSSWTSSRTTYVPYQMSDGTWRIRINSAGTGFTGGAGGTMTLTSGGVVHKTVSGNFIATCGSVSGTPVYGVAYVNGGASTISCYIPAGSPANVSITYDGELDAKPTWAD